MRRHTFTPRQEFRAIACRQHFAQLRATIVNHLPNPPGQPHCFGAPQDKATLQATQAQAWATHARARVAPANRRTWPNAPARLWVTKALAWPKGVLKKGMVLRLSGYDVEYLHADRFLVARRDFSMHDDFYCVGDVLGDPLGEPRVVPIDAVLHAVPFYKKADGPRSSERIVLVHPKF